MSAKFLDSGGLLYTWSKIKALLSEKADIVSENTSSGWADKPGYVPKKGEFCLYTDTSTLKIGDGSVPIADLSFIKDSDVQALAARLDDHINNKEVHVSSADRLFWNAKLNYETNGEELIFTRN